MTTLEKVQNRLSNHQSRRDNFDAEYLQTPKGSARAIQLMAYNNLLNAEIDFLTSLLNDMITEAHGSDSFDDSEESFN